jgi:hypothetical protein
MLKTSALIPLLRITERHFFESRPVNRFCRSQVQVPVNGRLDAIAAMPFAGPRGSAPDCKPWNARQHCELLPQREMVDEDGAAISW